MSLRIGSLFSGYGGTDRAVQSVIGGRVVWHSDIKPAAVRFLAYRHPDIPNLGDVLTIDYAKAAPIDVLAASWPCQGFSAAGKRLGERDPRALWPAVVRAVEATRPAIFFGENVARIAVIGELRRVARSLAHHGYVGAWRCVTASDSVRACHRRNRCFVVAVDPRQADLVADAASEHDHRARHLRSGRRDEPADGHSPALTLLPTPKASDGEKGGPGMRGSSGDLMLPSAVQTVNFGQYAAAVARHERVLGRPAPEPTQPAMRGDGRQLSAKFVEFMMMLPEGWVTDVPGLVDSRRKSERNAMLSLLGDGVCPPHGAFAFRFLLDHLVERLAQERAA